MLKWSDVFAQTFVRRNNMVRGVKPTDQSQNSEIVEVPDRRSDAGSANANKPRATPSRKRLEAQISAEADSLIEAFERATDK